MNALQHSMLSRFGQFSRAANFFTTSVNGYQALAPAVAQRNLDELQKLGLIVEIKTGYKLTSKGQAQVDWPGKTAPPPSRRPDYVPSKWEPARGAAADEHLNHKSLPVSAQIQRAG